MLHSLLFFIIKCGIAHSCVYSKFEHHHPHLLDYLVPNFVSFTASIAGLAHGKNRVLIHSLTQSLTHSAYLMPQEMKR